MYLCIVLSYESSLHESSPVYMYSCTVLSRYESSPVYIYLCTVLSRYESSPVYKMNTSQMHANLQEEYNSPEWQRALQTLNLSLEEVAHIRSVLTKAELEVGLQFTNC